MASIPRDEFDALVEADSPPTMTELAIKGTVRRAPAATARADSASRAHTLLREMATFCATQDPRVVARGTADPELVRGFATAINRWLNRLISSLPEDEVA
jgi:hypothetical protein